MGERNSIESGNWWEGGVQVSNDPRDYVIENNLYYYESGIGHKGFYFGGNYDLAEIQTEFGLEFCKSRSRRFSPNFFK